MPTTVTMMLSCTSLPSKWVRHGQSARAAVLGGGGALGIAQLRKATLIFGGAGAAARTAKREAPGGKVPRFTHCGSSIISSSNQALDSAPTLGEYSY
eukprot:3413037-Prymnesium_polylepis.2